MSLTNDFINLIRIFFPSFNTKCYHNKIRPDVEQAYCPDCGKLIENRWYITRCKCCGVKMKAIIKNGNIVPQEHFCSNCGDREYTVERIDKINFIDINFAVLEKHEINDQFKYAKTTTCWQEKNIEIPRLPVLFR